AEWPIADEALELFRQDQCLKAKRVARLTELCGSAEVGAWTRHRHYRSHPRRSAISSPRHASSRPKMWSPIRNPDPIRPTTGWSTYWRTKPTLRSTKDYRP